ncbi:hypothetical protein [Listeria booriae]|uniref:Uncharacterized protein n=1 Tax=Listeria booriae TaxID=1552123 RepID=A0A842FB24_9LIST|nr:hypothetical protein [Listeria booriae]MBC2241859.1 hypothetical protein [Listeria booriae]
MAKKKKRKLKPKNIAQSIETNQEKIVNNLEQQNNKMDEITIYLKAQNSKNIKRILSWLIPVVISIVSLVASMCIFFDTKKTTETMYFDTKRSTEIMNEMSIKNAPIDYKLNKVEIKDQPNLPFMIPTNDDIPGLISVIKLKIEAQNKQGKIKRAYLIPNYTGLKIRRENFQYLGNSNTLQDYVDVFTKGNSIIHTLPLYLLVEDYNSNISIDYLRIHYTPVNIYRYYPSKLIFDFKSKVLTMPSIGLFLAPAPYIEYRQIDYSALLDGNTFKKANQELEESLQSYKNKYKNVVNGIYENSGKNKSKYIEGFDYFFNENIEPISQNDVLTDVKSIKELYAQYYSN